MRPRRYTAEQRQEARDRVKRWNETHPAYHTAYWAGVRARKAGVPGSFTAAQQAARWAMWGNRCWMCGEAATCNDHVKPLHAGGPNWASNIRPACDPCNRAKWKTWPS